MKLRLLAVLLGMMAIASLCASPARAGGMNACELITQAEAQAALGMPVKKGKLSGPNPMGQTVCFFDTNQDTRVRLVQISLLPVTKGRDAKELFKQFTAFLSSPQPVANLGDEAMWGGSGLKMGSGLHLRQGQNILNVIVASGDQKRNLEQAKLLAQKALKRLK